MLVGLPWPPLCVGDLEGLRKVLGWPNIKMLGKEKPAREVRKDSWDGRRKLPGHPRDRSPT